VATFAGSPLRHAAFAVGWRSRVVGRVLAADLLAAVDVAALRVHQDSAAGAAALLGEERLER